MNTRKMLAAALRERSHYSTLCKSADLADAIDPTNIDESLLQIALRPTETSVFLGELADYFDSAKAAPVALPATTFTEAPALSMGAPADESTIRLLDQDETIEAGDEWRLKDGLHHSDRSKPVEWRPCGSSVGRCVDEFPDSIFRRKA